MTDKCTCDSLQLLRGLPNGKTHSHGCPESPEVKEFERKYEPSTYDSDDDDTYEDYWLYLRNLLGMP